MRLSQTLASTNASANVARPPWATVEKSLYVNPIGVQRWGAMPTTDELIAWARKHAQVLETDIRWVPSEGGYGGYWQAERGELKAVIQARGASALEFLERYAGPDSQWSIRAQRVVDSHGDRQSMESGVRALADVLRAWADQVEAGISVPRTVEANGARAVASTDLMEQVRTLNDDNSVHPAAPTVLAGAALEVALRSAVDELGLVLKERPSISSYARALRADGFLSAQDIKDVEQMGGIRNAAAHGRFDDISRERAGLLEQQVNLFLRRLTDLLDGRR